MLANTENKGITQLSISALRALQVTEDGFYSAAEIARRILEIKGIEPTIENLRAYTRLVSVALTQAVKGSSPKNCLVSKTGTQNSPPMYQGQHTRCSVYRWADAPLFPKKNPLPEPVVKEIDNSRILAPTTLNGKVLDRLAYIEATIPELSLKHLVGLQQLILEQVVAKHHVMENELVSCKNTIQKIKNVMPDEVVP